MVMTGKVWKVGDNIDTDTILPGQYLSLANPEELAEHCMEGIESDWSARIAQGDILVAGKNFGCGSSREHAPVAIKECGLSCVVAESFGAIFYRNSINVGLPVVELPGATEIFAEGSKATIDITTGRVENISTGQVFELTPMPRMVIDILNSGGLLEYISIQQKTA